ncbi:hypothetical protein LOK55_04355 [Microbacterium sp. F2E]|uniref:hypothetical protein n=1 Tax=Microbacterium sp. F2E TaxID=2895284 RepID=UPI001E5B47C2|nr:hypothetical protein [Microbacterium sp. F2E]MCC9053540.1 hypothetical protein [Microbacterium sp. F2E]
MSAPELGEDEVARSLAAKAFAAQIVAADLGEFDEQIAREALLDRWERAGSPPGAFLRAASMVVDLPARVSQSDASELEEFSISREDEIAAAKRATSFLERLAFDFEQL